MGVGETRTAKASWQGDLPRGVGRIGSGHPPPDPSTSARALAGTEITLEARLAGD